MSARCEAYKNTFTFDFFFFEGTTTEEPTTSSLSPTPNEKLPRDMY